MDIAPCSHPVEETHINFVRDMTNDDFLMARKWERIRSERINSTAEENRSCEPLRRRAAIRPIGESLSTYIRDLYNNRNRIKSQINAESIRNRSIKCGRVFWPAYLVKIDSLARRSVSEDTAAVHKGRRDKHGTEEFLHWFGVGVT